MQAIFDSRDAAYKTPFGAAQAGQEICFALRVPQDYGCRTPFLMLEADGDEQPIMHPLRAAGAQDGRDVFELRLEISQPGLYFYWFDLWVDYRKLYRGQGGKAIESNDKPGERWQLLVYDAAFETPEAAHGSVMYQIFPDRFCEGNPAKQLSYNERIYRKDKSKEPYYWPLEQQDGHLTMDYFGGDLAGIRQKLPYLQELGVGWIYLNPIFEAHANHRYNTADYLRVDPYLGTNEDFAAMCSEAKQRGMHVILDGVFNHTGSDSVYFNKEGRYATVGAWQGPQSPYRDWYRFLPDGSYESWWGFDTLPACNSQNKSWRQFICGEGGVVDFWLRLGASGWRLDVVDEIPDDFVAEIRSAVKRCGEDKLLIGEVWEDASNKMAYDERRKYFWGAELDGVMNYPFRTAILEFLRGGNGADFGERIMDICENYPAPALAACTTHLSSHDVARAITVLAGEPAEGHDRNWQSGRRLGQQEYELGILRMKLAFVLQFTLPGLPCVYYGDEVGMQGYDDPFNRAFFEWDSGEERLRPLVSQLAQLRRECAAFKHTGIRFLSDGPQMLVYRRFGGGELCDVAVNTGPLAAEAELCGQRVALPPMGFAWRTGKEK